MSVSDHVDGSPKLLKLIVPHRHCFKFPKVITAGQLPSPAGSLSLREISSFSRCTLAQGSLLWGWQRCLLPSLTIRAQSQVFTKRKERSSVIYLNFMSEHAHRHTDMCTNIHIHTRQINNCDKCFKMKKKATPPISII